jgi:hypothetical protein
MILPQLIDFARNWHNLSALLVQAFAAVNLYRFFRIANPYMQKNYLACGCFLVKWLQKTRIKKSGGQ